MARPSLLKLSEADERQLREAAAESPQADFVTAAVRFSAWPEVLLGRRWRSSFECIRLPSGVGAARYRQRGLAGLRGPEHDARGRPRRLQVEHLNC